MRTHAVHPFRWLLFGLLLFTTVAVARAAIPDLEITGRVTDASSGQPLASVQVSIPGLGVGALTNEKGFYTLRVPESLVSSDRITVQAQRIGYGTKTAVVRVAELRADADYSLDFALETTATALNAVVVSGDVAGRPPARAAGAMRATRVVAEAEAMPLPPQIQVAGSSWPVDHHPLEREQYAHIAENAFRAVGDHPLSTFSVDVDRASYSNLRRFLLRERRLPPVDAVQVEEMINYFAYGYATPRGDDPVAVTTELGSAPWRPEHRLLRIGLAAQPIEVGDLPPSNLVFLLDVSGSMSSPDKLPLMKSSLRLLVDQMRPEDHVSIVVYAGAAGLVLEPTSGAEKETIIEALDRLEAGGSTAGGAGLRLAYDVARRHFRPEGNNRVVLATDGDFNVGESSDGAMVRLIEDRREEGTFLTVLGFGTGNLQNSKMQQLAQHGNGNYGYIDSLHEARKILVREMGGTMVTVAKDVKIQIEFNPAYVRAYRLLGYENRLLANEDFNDDTKDAGEMGAGHTVTALYEVVPVESDSEVVASTVDPLRYQRVPESRRERRVTESNEIAFVRVRYKEPSGDASRLLERPIENRVTDPSDDFEFASAVAGFGMLLRDSEHKGSITAAQVMDLAESGLGRDEDGYRAGFLRLVQAYQSLEVGTDEPMAPARR